MMITRISKFRDIGLFDRNKNDFIKNFDSKEIISYHISVMSDQYYLVTTCLAACRFSISFII